MSRSVGIVVPAYQPDVSQLSSYITAIDEQLSPETLRVEIDAPSSGTLEAVAELPAVIGSAPERRGKGAAITAGFETLETDVLAFVDADGSTPVDSMASVLAPVINDKADLVAGSRRHPDAQITGRQTFLRCCLGRTFAWGAKRLVDPPLFDYQCGAKALTRRVWQAVRGYLHEPGFAWDVELVATTTALDYHVTEVPIRWNDKPGSTVSPAGTAAALAKGVLVARHRAKHLRESSLHSAIAAGYADSPALVESERERA